MYILCNFNSFQSSFLLFVRTGGEGVGSLSNGGDGPSCADDDISEGGEREPEVVSVAGNEIGCETVEDN